MKYDISLLALAMHSSQYQKPSDRNEVIEKWIKEYSEELYNRAYKEGRNDALFDPRNATPAQVFTRNKRILDNEKWLAENNEFEAEV